MSVTVPAEIAYQLARSFGTRVNGVISIGAKCHLQRGTADVRPIGDLRSLARTSTVKYDGSEKHCLILSDKTQINRRHLH